jgi:hypothetical protein
MILLISASQVARVAGVSRWHLADLGSFDVYRFNFVRGRVLEID